MIIKKTKPSAWAGNGFGTTKASYGVEGRPDIRIIRESHGWTAYLDGKKFFGLSKSDLEFELNWNIPSDDALLVALGPCGK